MNYFFEKLSEDKISQKIILARIFGLRQGFNVECCQSQDFKQTRTLFHPCFNISLADANEKWACSSWNTSVIYSRFHSTDSGTIMKGKVVFKYLALFPLANFQLCSGVITKNSKQIGGTGWNLPKMLIHLCRRSSGCTMAASLIFRASFISCQS